MFTVSKPSGEASMLLTELFLEGVQGFALVYTGAGAKREALVLVSALFPTKAGAPPD